MSIPASIFFIAIGAIVGFALRIPVDWLDLHVVGWVLITAGGIGLTLRLWLWPRRRRREIVLRDAPQMFTQRWVEEPRPGTRPPAEPITPSRPRDVDRPPTDVPKFDPARRADTDQADSPSSGGEPSDWGDGT